MRVRFSSPAPVAAVTCVIVRSTRDACYSRGFTDHVAEGVVDELKVTPGPVRLETIARDVRKFKDAPWGVDNRET